MSSVERLSITLPGEMARLIRHKVEQGDYASSSEVICEAVRAWQEQESRQLERYEAIRAKIAEAESDPRPSLTDEEVGRHFQERLRDRR